MRQLPPTRLELGSLRQGLGYPRGLLGRLGLGGGRSCAELSIGFLATLRIRSILLRDKALLSVNAPLGPNVLFSTGPGQGFPKRQPSIHCTDQYKCQGGGPEGGAGRKEFSACMLFLTSS